MLEVSLTAAPNWDNKKYVMDICGLQADLMGYFECILQLEKKVFNYFWNAFELTFLFHFLTIIVLLMILQSALSSKNTHIINIDYL